MGFYGADVAQLRGTATELEHAAGTLESITSLLGGELTRAPWHGADATTFRSNWDTDYSRRLVDASTRLRDAAKALRANADDQEQTSTVNGGPGDSGSSGGGGGGGGGGGYGPGGSSGGGGGGGGGGSWGSSSSSGEAVGWTGWGGKGEVGDNEATWRLGAYAKGEAETEFLGGTAKAEGEAGAGVKAHAESSYSFFGEADDKHGSIHENGLIGNGQGDPRHYGDDITKNDAGFKAGGEAYVKAGGWAEGSAEYSTDYGKVGATAEALAGVRADIGGGVSLGPEGAQIGGTAGAFAGAEAKGGIEAEVMGVGAGIEAGVRAGIGADLEANAEVSLDNVELEFEIGAALGVGFSVKPSISFSPSDMAHGIMSLFD